MANLRTNNLSGEQGQNAYRGSVFFDGDGAGLRAVESDSNLTFGTGDFTIEFWVLRNNTDQAVYLDWRNTGGAAGHRVTLYSTGSSSDKLNYYSNGANQINTTDPLNTNSWHHVALTRASSSTKLFVNGVQVGSTYSDSNDYLGPVSSDGIYIGRFAGGGYNTKGYISNLRVVKGTALYTSDFTPPQSELTVVDGTVLLCCQDSDNPTKDAVGTTITADSSLANTDFIKQQPKVIPPYGVDAGNAFGGPIQQSTQGYMYFPTGRTEERGRGRAVIGWANNPVNTAMDVFNIQSMGNSTVFGNLTSGNKWGSHAFSSTTRGLWAGGYLNSGPAFFNTIEFVTIASNGNPIDFGDTTSQNYRSGCCSSSTRGVIALGFVAPNFSKVNTIDFVTMASLGNATNFGDLFQTRANMSSASSPTRGFFAGGETPTYVNTIDFVTIASAGDASNFGDLNSTPISSMAMASTTRGIIGGGYPTPANTNIIDFITIASTGDATDFGDLTGLYSVGSATSNNTRGVFCGGYTAPSKHNLMEFVTIATTGNAQDFGDMTYARRDFGACSDSHGGLS